MLLKGASSFEHVTILQPAFFMDNLLNPVFGMVPANGLLRMPLMHDTQMLCIAVRDVSGPTAPRVTRLLTHLPLQIGAAALSAFATPAKFVGRVSLSFFCWPARLVI
jgi:hypothetical protein